MVIDSDCCYWSTVIEKRAVGLSNKEPQTQAFLVSLIEAMALLSPLRAFKLSSNFIAEQSLQSFVRNLKAAT